MAVPCAVSEEGITRADFVVELPHVFSSDECDRLTRNVTRLGQTEGTIGTKDGSGAALDRNVRRVRQTTLPRAEETRWVYDRLTRVLGLCNSTHFRFEVESLENLKIVDYQAGDFYDWHLDLGRGAASRKLSVSVMLSPPDDYEGGALTFPGAELARMARGDAVVFASFLLHGVQPVKGGRRLALVGWLGGPPFR